MRGLVTVEDAAEENGLAAMLSGLLDENVTASAGKRRDLEAIRTRFAVVAPDAGVAVTLAFDGRGCRILDGERDAEVTITADSGRIPEASLVEIRHGLPWFLDGVGQGLLRALARREIRIAGLIAPAHPGASLRRARDLVRLARMLSADG